MKLIKKNNLNILTLQVGLLLNNCYLAWDEVTKEALLIDPGGDFSKIYQEIKSRKLNLKFILLTHGHFDHTGAVTELKKEFNCQVLLSKEDKIFFSEETIEIKDNDKFKLGEIIFKVIKTPGHTPGSICILTDDLIFTGDTIFSGAIGRTDLIGGNENDLKKSLKKISSLLNEKSTILPGHGEITSFLKEKPFLKKILNQNV